jgi:uncharacterized protein
MRELDLEDGRAAVLGGLVYGAGGGGLERGLRACELVFDVGRPVLVSLDELDDDDQVVVMTGVGAPGVQRQLVWPSDGLRAKELLLESLAGNVRVVGTMTAHPGAYLAGTWLANALDPTLLVVDCATNGRGHPTVAMGGMGLAGRNDVTVSQAAVGGDPAFEGHLEMVARGPIGKVSSVLHHASAEVGGVLLACRGPFSVEFCRQAGAVGAVSACIRLGEAMAEAEGKGAQAMLVAILGTLGGRELGRGPLLAAGTELRGAWDVGSLTVDLSGSKLEIAICNEYMAADLDGVRVATYPDLIVTLSPADGLPTAAAHLAPGDEVVVAVVPRANIPLGAGVWDAAVYEEVERMLGVELVRYSLQDAPAA